MEEKQIKIMTYTKPVNSGPTRTSFYDPDWGLSDQQQEEHESYYDNILKYREDNSIDINIE